MNEKSLAIAIFIGCIIGILISVIVCFPFVKWSSEVEIISIDRFSSDPLLYKVNCIDDDDYKMDISIRIDNIKNFDINSKHGILKYRKPYCTFGHWEIELDE